MGNQPSSTSDSSRPALSVVIPLLNEGAVVRVLYDRLQGVLSRLVSSYEIIMVDDGSSDDTFLRLQELYHLDHAVKIIRLTRNFGQQTALSAGLERSAGDYVALMDGDLQDPPELLPTLLAKLGEGYDVAYAVRASRPEGWFKQTAYYLFYRLLRAMASVKIPLDAGDFCVMRRKVVLAINRLPERNRFLRGLRHWVGFRQVGVLYARDARAGGEVKYTWGKLMQLSLNGIMSFSDFPLRLAAYLGFLVSTGSFIGIGIVLYFRLCTNKSIPGFASLAILVLFLGGIQLLAVGVLGEYLGRTLDEVKRRPPYLVSELVGWPADVDLAQQPSVWGPPLEPVA